MREKVKSWYLNPKLIVMNQTFSFQRFSLLVAKHWAENRKRYLLSMVAYISLVFVWFVFVMLTDESNPLAKGLQQVTFFFSLFLVGPFYASQFFSELGSKTKGNQLSYGTGFYI